MDEIKHTTENAILRAALELLWSEYKNQKSEFGPYSMWEEYEDTKGIEWVKSIVEKQEQRKV